MKMKYFSLIIICLYAMLSTLQGCINNNENIAGKWEWPTKALPDGSKTTIIYDFHKDGRLTVTSHTVSEKQHINVERIATCNYTYRNNTIKYSFSAENIEFTKYEIEGLSQEEINSRIEFDKKYSSDLEEILTNVKVEGNKLEANIGKMHITFTRIN